MKTKNILHLESTVESHFANKRQTSTCASALFLFLFFCSGRCVKQLQTIKSFRNPFTMTSSCSACGRPRLSQFFPANLHRVRHVSSTLLYSLLDVICRLCLSCRCKKGIHTAWRTLPLLLIYSNAGGQQLSAV